MGVSAWGGGGFQNRAIRVPKEGNYTRELIELPEGVFFFLFLSLCQDVSSIDFMLCWQGVGLVDG